jgi:hypothetical protein
VSRQIRTALIPLVVLAGCSQHPATEAPSPSSTSTASRTATPNAPPTVAAPTAQSPRTEKWVDLHVGDCVAEVPPVDLGAVTVDVVDCSTPHQAEVYLLAPIAVNAAITDVANQACSAGVTPYTGNPPAPSPWPTSLIRGRTGPPTIRSPAPSSACSKRPTSAPRPDLRTSSAKGVRPAHGGYPCPARNRQRSVVASQPTRLE